MRNSEAIKCLVTAAETAQDPLDQLACLRAGAWLRWCDGFGATLTRPEAERIAAGGALGEVARGLLRRFVGTYPVPPEDARLNCLIDDGETAWGLQDIAQWSAVSSNLRRETRESDVVTEGRVESPFGSVGVKHGCTDLPAPDPWS